MTHLYTYTKITYYFGRTAHKNSSAKMKEKLTCHRGDPPLTTDHQLTWRVTSRHDLSSLCSLLQPFALEPKQPPFQEQQGMAGYWAEQVEKAADRFE
jgi:hypothetical protein